jgi:hypothetical protein
LVLLIAGGTAHGAGLSLREGEGTLHVEEDGKPVLVYRHDFVEAPGLAPPSYRRAGYIHPLHGLDGEELTEDFPADHYHHRGVFWAWPECRVGERPMDVWTLKGVRSRPERWLEREVREGRAHVAVENRWSFDDRPEDAVVRETVRFTVHPADGDRRAIDFTLSFENVSGMPITFLGAKDKGYGGFCVRPPAARKPMQFTTATGPLEEDALRWPTPWTDVSFPTAPGGPLSGLAIFQHPDNPGYPHPGWIMRHYAFLGASWPHETTHILEAGASFTLRYRLLVHRGDAEAAGVRAAFEAFQAQPPR